MKRLFILSLAVLLSFPFTSFAAQRVLLKTESIITSGIAVSGSTILFGDASGIFSAASSNTQSTLWTYQAGDATTVGTPAVFDGQVIFAQATGELTCLNISDGSVVWTYAPKYDESVNEGLSDGVSVGGGLVYAAYTTGELKAIDLKTGRQAWSYKTDHGLRTAPVYSNGLVLLGEYDGLFSMLDAKTGKRLNGGGAGGALNTPAVSGGKVYYSAWDGSVHAVQIKDVIPLWSAKLGEPITSAPSIGGGLVVVGTAGGKVAALSEKDGALLWQYESNGGQIVARPVISGERVSFGTEDGRVLILDARTGRLRNEYSGRFVLNTDPAFGGNRLYFTNGKELCSEE